MMAAGRGALTLEDSQCGDGQAAGGTRSTTVGNCTAGPATGRPSNPVVGWERRQGAPTDRGSGGPGSQWGDTVGCPWARRGVGW